MQYTAVLVNSHVEKSPALAVAVLLRMEGLDFSRQFISPAAESLPNDNINIFRVQYVLDYKIPQFRLHTQAPARPATQ